MRQIGGKLDREVSPAKVRHVAFTIGAEDACLNAVGVTADCRGAGGILVKGGVDGRAYRQAVDIGPTGVRAGGERTGWRLCLDSNQHFAIIMHAPTYVVVAGTRGRTILVDDCVALPGIELHGDTGFGSIFRRAAVANGGVHETFAVNVIEAWRLNRLGDTITAGPAAELSLASPEDHGIVNRSKADAEPVRRPAIVA